MSTPIYAHPTTVAALPESYTPVDVVYVDDSGNPTAPPSGGLADNAVTTAKIADKAVTAGKIADGVIPTVPGKATSSADGLMSKEDKAKLDGIAANANAYTLPAASTAALGGVKQAAHVDGASGTVQQLVDSLVAAGIMAGA